MSDRNRPAVFRCRALRALPRLSLGLALCAVLGCASTPPYYLIESRFTESGRSGPAPDVTQTPDLPAVHHLIQLVALKPPDVCADRGQSGHLGTASLELGVLRTRCGVEMAELERALARAGYRVVSWDALHHLAASRDIPILQAASELRADALFQVNTLERIDIRPGADARWERRFHRAQEDGSRAGPALVPASQRGEFESLVARRERGLVPARRIGATINVSVVSVATGTAIWFYEWTRIEDVGPAPRLEILVDCDDEGCREVAGDAASSGEALSDRSTASIAREGEVPDDSQAVFQVLVRDLVTDLAERFAGRR